MCIWIGLCERSSKVIAYKDELARSEKLPLVTRLIWLPCKKTVSSMGASIKIVRFNEVRKLELRSKNCSSTLLERLLGTEPLKRLWDKPKDLSCKRADNSCGMVPDNWLSSKYKN